jgi:hypothetical protein
MLWEIDRCYLANGSYTLHAETTEDILRTARMFASSQVTDALYCGGLVGALARGAYSSRFVASRLRHTAGRANPRIRP